MIELGDIVVLVIVIIVKGREGIDFLFFLVDYEERFYVGGKIFGGFLCWEGCFLEKVIFIGCLIDRFLCFLFFSWLWDDI